MKNKVVFFSSLPHDVESFNGLKNSFLDNSIEFEFISKRLNQETVHLVHDSEIICVFVNDQLNKNILNTLKQKGLRLIVLRCAGYNNVDLDSAKDLGISVLRVPAYSPNSVAEHAVALMMCLNRKLHTAHKRTQDGNFSIDGLMGFNMYQKTIGIIGTGKIGLVTAQILNGFGAKIIAYDPYPQDHIEFISYHSLDEVLMSSDIISLHCPLNDQTKYLINAQTISKTKPGFMLINTSRGAVLETNSVISALKTGQIGSFGMDVYENEEQFFHADHSNSPLTDDNLSLLKGFPNTIITSHQGFFTQEAVSNIASITLNNIKRFIDNQAPDPNNVVQ
jgi:D-lactate dehydrogenase